MGTTTVPIEDDEAIVAADLSSKLGQLGYDVVGSMAEGEEAVEVAYSPKPAVVLMDIRLKGSMNGIETDEAILHRHCAPIIYLTAHSDAATLEHAMLSDLMAICSNPSRRRREGEGDEIPRLVEEITVKVRNVLTFKKSAVLKQAIN
jgi:DNA-binding NarL/FixJ family response regulator